MKEAGDAGPFNGRLKLLELFLQFLHNIFLFADLGFTVLDGFFQFFLLRHGVLRRLYRIQVLSVSVSRRKALPDS